MILHFTITVLVIYGIKASTGKGMLLEPLYNKYIILMDRIFSKPMTYENTKLWYTYITKPLFDCTPCMASVWGSLSFWLYYPDPTVMAWVIWVFALAGFNYLINKKL